MRKSGLVCLAVAGAVGALQLAACSSGDGTAGTGTVAVSLKEGGISLSPASHPAGDITFRIANTDQGETHELVVVRTDLAAGQLPLADDGAEVDENEVEVVDELEDVAPGRGGDLTVRLEPGHYVLMCNLPGHYGMSMHADFEVTP